jgi:hypothetical protein
VKLISALGGTSQVELELFRYIFSFYVISKIDTKAVYSNPSIMRRLRYFILGLVPVLVPGL